jgi:hypothetical protein
VRRSHTRTLGAGGLLQLLDHLMDDDTIVDLIGMLDHPEPKVRIAARDHDGDPAVRKKAAWYLPGGAVHRRGH